LHHGLIIFFEDSTPRLRVALTTLERAVQVVCDIGVWLADTRAGIDGK
jgi:hypothetical protein